MADDLRKATHSSPKNFIRPHGVGLRGLTAPRGSEQFEGRFGRMFRTLPAAEHTDADLKALAAEKAMTAEFEAVQTPETDPDDEENVDGDHVHVSAGYTYFGQFVDHDITFDPASSLQKQNDPDGLVDFRTPRFDLDSVYGRGPDDQPYLYDGPVRMHLGEKLDLNPGGTQAFDLPRFNGRALIGDPRNDENSIVSQFQGIMLRFHNRVADVLGSDASFAEVQQTVRWHYQWAVLHDFLPTIAGENVVNDILPHLDNGKSIKEGKPQLFFFHWRDAPFMPLEFSVAAYRFGHSMVRPIYRLNRKLPTTPESRILIFAKPPQPSLAGFRPLDKDRTIEWDLFFPIRKKAPVLGKDRLQPAYKIDSSLVNPLGNLPPEVASNPAILAERNLLRGKSFGLPSGQSVARYMGHTPLTEDELRVGKAPDDKKNKRLVDISPKFNDNAPLWYYILAEAQHQNGGKHLGTVGGRIVAEVIIGLIAGDNFSYLAQDPTWRPNAQLCRDGKNFHIADLIVAATAT